MIILLISWNRGKKLIHTKDLSDQWPYSINISTHLPINVILSQKVERKKGTVENTSYVEWGLRNKSHPVHLFWNNSIVRRLLCYSARHAEKWNNNVACLNPAYIVMSESTSSLCCELFCLLFWRLKQTRRTVTCKI